MSEWSELFRKLAESYGRMEIAHPILKGVTLAQWAVESGRGTSDLATKHLNFGGLKWRSEMEGFATKVRYEAHDGIADYCAFADLEAFIRGYWRFLERSPYRGWEAHAGSAVDFIRYIGPTYCESPGYAEKVLALLPEVQQLLQQAGEARREETELPTEAGAAGKRIYVGAGHSGTDPGAVAHGYREADLATELRDMVAARIRAAGVAVMTDGEAGQNKSLAESITLANGCGPNRIELHLNSATPAAKGVECLSLEAQRPLARKVAGAIAEVMEIPLRGREGWKSDSEGQHPRLAFCREGGGVVTECFF